MNILARVLGFSKPEVRNTALDSDILSSPSTSPAARQQNLGDGGISILKRQLRDDCDDFDDFDERQNAGEESTKKARGMGW